MHGHAITRENVLRSWMVDNGITLSTLWRLRNEPPERGHSRPFYSHWRITLFPFTTERARKKEDITNYINWFVKFRPEGTEMEKTTKNSLSRKLSSERS